MLYVAGQITQAAWGPRAGRYQHGKRLRKKVPRERHADLIGSAARDPVAILAAGDRNRVPELIPVRYERMLVSPFATPEENVVFDINGFDETLAGIDFTVDLKRLAASVAVAALAVKLPGTRARALAAATVEAYRSRIADLAELSPLEIWHSKIHLAREIERIEDRSLRQKLSAIVSKVSGHLEEDDNFPHLVKGKQARIEDRPPLIYHFTGRRDARHRVDERSVFASYQDSLAPERRCLIERYALT